MSKGQRPVTLRGDRVSEVEKIAEEIGDETGIKPSVPQVIYLAIDELKKKRSKKRGRIFGRI